MTSNESSSTGFSAEQFAADIEHAANREELITAEIQATPEVWAIKGRPAVTSLLTESLVAASRIDNVRGKGFEPYDLSDTASSVVDGVETIIALSPLYDLDLYVAVGDYVRDDRFYRSGRNKPPKEPRQLRTGGRMRWLADPQLSDYHAEIGLAVLRDKIPPHSDSKRSKVATHNMTNCIQSMKLNGSVDAHITAGLATIQRSDKHSPEDYATGVLELARLTALAVANNNAIAQRQTSTSAGLRRMVRRIIQ